MTYSHELHIVSTFLSVVIIKYQRTVLCYQV